MSQSCQSCGSNDVVEVSDAAILTYACRRCGATWSPSPGGCPCGLKLEYCHRLYAARVCPPPDGPASPVLGDEERERLKKLIVKAWCAGYESPDQFIALPAVEELADELLAAADQKLTQGEERDA